LELPLTEGVWKDKEAPYMPTLVSSGEYTILYVEDNLANLRVIEHLLKPYPNIHLISAMQGQIGIDIARQHRPSLILLDLHLPDLQGAEVLRILKSDSATRDIPVVVLSADATSKQQLRLMELGAVAYLTKPLNLRHFLETVNSFMKQSTQ
jgi:CheY-like chemotaxis protein